MKYQYRNASLYYNDPEWRVLAEYNGLGIRQRTIVWGNPDQSGLREDYGMDLSSIDELLRLRVGAYDYYYLHDHLYSPAVLIGYGYENGQWQWRPVERYPDKIGNAYGTARVINRGPDNAWFTADDVVTGFSTLNTTLFTGRTLDALDSGALKIMYYRNRYTDPFTGRFLQQDPIGYIDGMCLYQYSKNNPLIYSDATGTMGKDPGRQPLPDRCPKCYCPASVDALEYFERPRPIYPERRGSGNVPFGEFVGARVRFGATGGWIDWNHPDLDGRGGLLWWEWYSTMPTTTPPGSNYPPNSTNQWVCTDKKRAPEPFIRSVLIPKTGPDLPGVNPGPGMGPFNQDAYIVVIARPHPKCPCKSQSQKWEGVHQKINLIATQSGGVNVFQNTIDLIPDTFPNPPGVIPYPRINQEFQQLFNQGGNQ